MHLAVFLLLNLQVRSATVREEVATRHPEGGGQARTTFVPSARLLSHRSPLKSTSSKASLLYPGNLDTTRAWKIFHCELFLTVTCHPAMLTSPAAPLDSQPPMANGQELPKPARGDIYTFGGRLTVTNAAANIFVVYNRRPTETTSTPPSGLSLDFVMGNVYLIDATFISPFTEGTSRSGNLVKGLGLQSEGCHLGDTSIETVYDDIVCVVTNQPGADCNIGTVAGNVVTVCNMGCHQENSLPENVKISTIVGFELKEPPIVSGGGLKRALSAWASLTFPPSWWNLRPAKPTSTETTRVPNCNPFLVQQAPPRHNKHANKKTKMPKKEAKKPKKEVKTPKKGPKRKKVKGSGPGPLATGANCIPIQRRPAARLGMTGDGTSDIQWKIKKEPIY